jgi:hemerythrin-like metal-binding protein
MAIIWSEERMATGIREVDEQHKGLLRHFNEFHEAMRQGKGQATAIRLLGFLADYTEKHFTCEEACMTRYRCPAAAANLAAHNSLRQEIAVLRSHIKENKLTVMDLVKVEQTLGTWIRDHIGTIDIQLRGCVAHDR